MNLELLLWGKSISIFCYVFLIELTALFLWCLKLSQCVSNFVNAALWEYWSSFVICSVTVCWCHCLLLSLFFLYHTELGPLKYFLLPRIYLICWRIEFKNLKHVYKWWLKFCGIHWSIVFYWFLLLGNFCSSRSKSAVIMQW